MIQHHVPYDILPLLLSSHTKQIFSAQKHI